MPGFFTPEEIEERTKTEFDFDEGPNCQKCGLFRACQSPKMQYTGEGKKGVLIIAEATGKTEDQQWKQLGYDEPTQLIGDAGQLLRQELKILKLDLDSDFWKTNALSCRPISNTGANRPPTKTEIKYCKPLVEKTIRELQPKMIWLMGGKAIESMYTGRFKYLAINRWRKLCIPDRKTGAYIIPLFHPSYILRNDYDENLKATFKRDLKWAASCIRKEPFTWTDERDEVICLYDFDQVIGILEEIILQADMRPTQLFLDYETNCLKPQWPGAKIATISLCQGYDKPAYAFPYKYKDFFTKKQQTHIKAMMRRLLQHKQISWIAQNIKFEDSWTRNIFGVRPYSWQWDTMLAAHIEDNRSNYTKLEFQSYIKFGLDPYDKEIEKYLKSKTGHFNQVDKAPLKKLLLYGGLDSKMGMKLYNEQQKMLTLSLKLQVKHRLAEAYQLFHQGTLAFSDIQQNGICIDEDYYKREDQKLTTEITQIENKLKTSEEAVQFQEETNKKLDFGSTRDLGKLFYEVLGLPKQLTAKKNYQVDVNALDNIKLPFVDDLLRLRKLEKIKGTDFAQLLREVCNGKVYPFFNLNIPVSYRSSSSKPNWQNQQSHDIEAGRLVRSGIFPLPGNKIGELDYKSIEVIIAAIITQDPNLIKYVLDPTTDMHRDVSMDIWMLPADEITKDIRFRSKGGWTFSQFYGSYYKNCAIDLWKGVDCKTMSGVTLRNHLQDQHICSLNEFIEHCKNVQNIFWGERFKVYAQWKEDINKLYRKQGYIENKFGFRFTMHMSERQVSNFPIQSTAFLILLHSLILINERAKEENWLSKILGQIHDSILIDLHPEEEEYLLKTCLYIMSEKMRELHPWITVPIPVEIELTGVDGSWWTKKEVEIWING